MRSETAEKILKTANTLIAERGYSAFSYADISEAVGIRKASIHHHFPTKAGLVVAVLKEHRQRLVEGTELLDREISDPLARIGAYMKHWEECIRNQTMPFCVAALMAAELPALPDEVQAEIRQHFTTLSQWLEKTLKAGVKMQVIKLQGSVATEAQILMAVVHGAMLSARASGAPAVFQTITKAALKQIAVPKY
ncbi:TetR/AcrR family transcriptional regulator [Granulicella sp. WH15]|uniref:TetR/AcrR family transcriptional regulator n=1 Tax=Granulicella sp. WH15 TaxID=2602070 RepID=UPI0013674284|nr:TetR/AcrR family transcriptional regulator [Granulicella sp. WH15]QHN03665.1 TetR/AcrR family transcriptional regulator [Granulicella sp. WH15]